MDVMFSCIELLYSFFYRQQVNYTIWKVEALGRWSEEGGECIDEVT